MSPHAQLVLAVGFTALCAIIAVAFVLWLSWKSVWDAYDYLMQQFKRRRNRRFDARVGRDVKAVRQ